MAGEQVPFEEIRDVIRTFEAAPTVPQLAEWIEAVALDLARIAQEVRETTDAKTSVLIVLRRLSDDARERAAQDAAAQDALNGYADELDAAQDEISDAVVANTPADPDTGGATPNPADTGGNTEPGSAGSNPTDSTPSGDSPVGAENTSGTVTLPTGGEPSTPDTDTVQP